MRNPDRGMLRTAGFGVLLCTLLVVPALAGFAIAGTARLEAPAPNAAPVRSDSPQASSAPDAGQVISRTPVGQVPASAEDALTRQQADNGGLPRIQYVFDASGYIRLGNGDVIPLGDGVEVAVAVDPYPPSDFDMDVQYTVTADGVAVDDAVVDTTWDMVFMYHGPFETEMAHIGDGRYRASYDFFMFGPWEVQTRLQIPGYDPIDFAVSIYVWPTG